MVLRGDLGADKDGQMPNLRVNDVEDPLTTPPDLVYALVVVENPAQRLLRWRDVVSLRTEAHDRCLDLTDVETNAIAGHDLRGRKLVPDKEIVDHPLHFLAAQQDEIPPPLLEMQIAALLLLRICPNVVLFRPQRVAGVEIVKVRNQPGGVEDAVAKVAHEAVKPGAAQDAAKVAHRVLAVDAAPVGKRRTRDQNRSDDVWTHAGSDYRVPAGLAVAEHKGLAEGLGMQFVHLLNEDSVRTCHVLDPLPVHRGGGETGEIHWMTSLERFADLANRLEPSDARALAGAGINDDDRALALVDLRARWWDDPEQRVVDRPG